MAGFIGGRTSAFDYIGPDLPNNPQNGEMWFDTDGASDGSGEVKVYDGAGDAWEATGFTSHADLTDVTRSAHHPPVDVSGPLTQPSDQSLGLSIGDGLLDSNGTLVADLGNGLGIDSNGQVYVPASAVEQSMLAFDTATQAELDGHAGDTTNPHNVTDDQTGAASALSDHENDTTNPHGVDHSQLSGVGANDHHEKSPTIDSNNAYNTTNEAVTPGSYSWGTLWNPSETKTVYNLTVSAEDSNQRLGGIKVHFSDGSTQIFGRNQNDRGTVSLSISLIERVDRIDIYQAFGNNNAGFAAGITHD